MENELHIIAGLTPEQIAERATAVVLELDYWQQILNDCETVNDAVLAATNASLEATAGALVLLQLLPAEQVPLVGAIVEQQRLGMNALLEISNALGGTLELAAGRHAALRPVGTALRRAAGLDDDDETGPAA
jgi:hypothetical protein